AHSLRESESAAESCIEIDKVEARPGVAVDERSVHGRPGVGALDGGCPSGDVERQCGVILQHGAQLKAVAEMFPNILGVVCGGLCRAVEDETVSLVVVRASIVLPDVVVIDRRAEEKLPD